MKFTVNKTEYKGKQEQILFTIVSEKAGKIRMVLMLVRLKLFRVGISDTNIHGYELAKDITEQDIKIMNTMLEIVEKQPHLLEIGEFHY